MKRALILLAALLPLCSCDMLGRLFSDSDSKVASVGRSVLYRSDVANVVPSGLPEEDSVKLARQFIDNWVLGELLLKEASETLSKDQKDISAQISQFRKNLLTFRYEKACVAERLDTLVTLEEARAYYDEHSKDYVSPVSIIRCRVIEISKKSPYYEMIRETYTTDEEADVSVLEQTCFTAAQKYSDFGKKWIASTVLARELGIGVEECEADLKKSSAYEKEAHGQHFLVYIQSRTAPGEISPLEYNFSTISDILVSRRKKEIIASLEQELFEEGLSDGKIKYYDR